MGNSASNQDEGHGNNNHVMRTYEDDDEYAAQFDGIDTLGYRVLGVQPNSPASEAGLVSFLDFIVGANEQMLLGSSQGLEVGQEYDDVDFPALLRDAASKDETVELRTFFTVSCWGVAFLVVVVVVHSMLLVLFSPLPIFPIWP